MVISASKRLGDLLLLGNGLVFIVLINIISTSYFFRIDLTAEHRFTLNEPTKNLLLYIDDDVYVDVYLAGDLNADFTRLQKSIQETLEEFRVYSKNRIQYRFIDPSSALSKKAQNEFMTELAQKGISPMNVIDSRQGQRSEKIVFPGALVSYGGFETGIMFLKGNRAESAQEVLNQSIEGIEFELANAINKLVNSDRKRIGFVKGHGELDTLSLASLNNALLDLYDVYHVDLSNRQSIENYDALIIAKPQTAYSELDKYKLDQYLMRGGKLLFLLDRLDASMDSASNPNYFAFPYTLKLEDLLFKYGVRINLDLVQDRVSAKYPIVTGQVGNRPQIMQIDWPFYPLITQYQDHPITRNLDASILKFVSSMDTVKAEGVKKTPLLFTSPNSKILGAPVKIGVDDLRKQPNLENFEQGRWPVAYLLEGEFASLYKNRFKPEGADEENFVDLGKPSKIIVVSDGDIARNEINTRNGQAQQLGNDPVTGYTFANQDLLLNMVAYLTDENGLIKIRSKELMIRPLDKVKISDQRIFWQVFNLMTPLALILIFGLLRNYLRKRRYGLVR